MLHSASPVSRWGYFYCTLSTVLTTMTITPETTEVEDRAEIKRQTLKELIANQHSARATYNHVRLCLSMWQSFALVDQRGTIWAIYDELTEAIKGCVDHNSAAEDEHEDQRNCYTLVAWKWPVPLDPDKKRSIYVHPDIWVKASEGWPAPRITANTDDLVLASNVNPFDDKYEVYYP